MAGLSGATGGSQNTTPSAKVLSSCTEQCLVLGKYSTSREFCLEVLLIHMQSCYIRSKDSNLNLWYLMSIIIRLALKLGYHQDPTKLPMVKLSPFNAEMRRRVWATIFQIDTLMSFQMGLPSMIPTEYCDTELPRNLENSDFGPETQTIPPPRPESDYTPILYVIAKSSIMSAFKAVIAHTRSLAPSTYDAATALDTRLRDAYSNLPAVLKYTPISHSIVDSPGVIMDRTTIEILQLKSIIVLHRQYMTAHRSNPLFDPSRNACLQAAETVLHRQVELHEATQPGCQLYDQRWMVSALTICDFILAAMIVCLEMTIRTHQSHSPKEDKELTRYLDTLRRCRDIRAVAADVSSEARMALDAIESTIRRAKEARSHVSVSVPEIHAQQLPAMESGDQSLPHDQVTVGYDEAAYIDWVILDNQFQEPWAEGLDLDSWVLDAMDFSSVPIDLA